MAAECNPNESGCKPKTPDRPKPRPDVAKKCEERMSLKDQIDQGRKKRHRILMDISNLESQLKDQKEQMEKAKAKRLQAKTPQQKEKEPALPAKPKKDISPETLKRFHDLYNPKDKPSTAADDNKCGCGNVKKRKCPGKKLVLSKHQQTFQRARHRDNEGNHCKFDSDGFINCKQSTRYCG